MKSKLLLSLFTLANSFQAFAGEYLLNCTEPSQQYEISIQQELNLGHLQETEALLKVSNSESHLFSALGTANLKMLRTGRLYTYKFPLDEIHLTLQEKHKATVFPPHCNEHSRMTCDYIFETYYQGVLSFNGENLNVSCK